MKLLATIVVAGVAAWASWLFRYDVQVIPVFVPELYSNDGRGWIIDENDTLLRFDPSKGDYLPGTNAAGQPVKPLIAKSPAIVWRWDRWTATGSVEQIAQVDASGRVTLAPLSAAPNE